ncbi:MAG: flavodoxin [Mogibacterium sp.]|nr:flavodoxin [Mogibacterium sp.]
MSKRIKVIAALLILSLLVFAGCSKTNDTAEEPAETETAQTEEQEAAPDETASTGAQDGSDVLVVYFSATGNTKGVAEKIASITGADIYEIKPAQEYTSADLDWNDSDSRTTHEQNDKSARPEIGSDPASLEGYSTIYIGFPIWWGEEPRIMDTFVESYDFDGITMIPFCTSSSSGIGMSGKNLESNAGSGNWLDGERFGEGASEEEIQAWIDGLK